jgi:hypothetical protein
VVKASTSFFCPVFLCFIGCNDLPLDRTFLSIKTAENILYLLLQYFVRMKEHVFVQIHLCH